MMRGEYYAPPPAPPKPAEKSRRKRVVAPKPTAAMGDIIPPDDFGPGSDMFEPKKDEPDEQKQWVYNN